MANPSHSVSVERVITAPPEKIFAVVADPARHHEIDGSGMVVASEHNDPERLSRGARFGMKMRLGIPYSMVNEVVEFDENRRIAWRPRLARPEWAGRLTGGYVWRYELQPADEGRSTHVRESYDWSAADPFTRAYIIAGGWPRRARRAMTKTLERLDQLVAGGGSTARQ